MSEILFHYHPVNPTTWVYLSSLLIVGLFFKFNRFWSVRNLDLVMLIALSPGLLLVLKGMSLPRAASQTASNARQDAFQTLQSGSPDRSAPLASGEQGDRQPPVAGDARLSAQASEPRTTATVGVQASGSGVVLPAPEPGQETNMDVVRLGFIWLFVVGGAWLVRLLLDPAMVRRPLLEPNLNAGGMTFVGICLFVFLMANVLTGEPTISGLSGARQSESPGGRSVAALNSEDGRPLENGNDNSGSVQTGDRSAQGGDRLGTSENLAGNQAGPTADPQQNGSMARVGPGYPLLFLLPRISTSSFLRQVEPNLEARSERVYALTARLVAILSHLAIVVGMIFIGYMHFDNIRTGVATATLYLMLPYTSQLTGFADHCVPAALLVWLIASYRRPLIAGLLLGMAAGTIYYPAFLLPLWISFYWQKGLPRFLLGMAVSLLVMSIGLRLSSNDWWHYWLQLTQMFGIRSPLVDTSSGFWDPAILHRTYRLPVLAAFVVLSFGMFLWPAHKNLGTLLNCSAAVMLGTQFWHAHNGGIFMAWYLPLLLLTVFRPNLEDRVAIAVLAQSWLERKSGVLQRASTSARSEGRMASMSGRPSWLAMPISDRHSDVDAPQPLRS